MMASDLARASKTSLRESGDDTHAECPLLHAILPSAVMAYFSRDRGRPVAALWSSACVKTSNSKYPQFFGQTPRGVTTIVLTGPVAGSKEPLQKLTTAAFPTCLPCMSRLPGGPYLIHLQTRLRGSLRC